MRRSRAWTGCAAGTARSGPGTCSAPPARRWPAAQLPQPEGRAGPEDHDTDACPRRGQAAVTGAGHHLQGRPGAQGPRRRPGGRGRDLAAVPEPASDPAPGPGADRHELSEDPHDLIARYLLHTTAHLSHGTTVFGAIYLLSHGIAKIVLVALVLKDKLWAYPWLIGLLLAFIAYQLYRITAVHFSIGLALLTVFDAFLAWLTWREYRSKRAQQQARAAVAAPS